MVELFAVKLILIPVVIALVAAEALGARRAARQGWGAGFDWYDAITNAGIGTIGQLTGIGFRAATLGVTAWVAGHTVGLHVAHWPGGSIGQFFVALLAWDFLFYWFHRAGHRTSIGWASHSAHHESPYFNFSVALRLEWFPVLQIPIFALLGIAGFAPSVLAAASIANGLYQGFLHTELVGRLPRPIEAVLNTPAHHRAHHQRSLVRGANFGGVLIIWDRLFGTFAVADPFPIAYGVDGAVPLPRPFAMFTPVVRALGWRPFVSRRFGSTLSSRQPNESPS